ncbi:hypothetical protein J7E38_16190 [Bacillus sp. ISL-35]|uniref:hypothetical protein n=1 Tax=Bacillus sp. ISL-35 TaxID=2819122 RepID=UPI001BE700DC|nr:hypothetical protein [Bacillus sp. ISL-35]MBT2680550.1 hypothetical protein [Bacillus sp. ISL-35]MBT2704156.1 hypothetical protein [Chryseobacterium sp. ISL-80]
MSKINIKVKQVKAANKDLVNLSSRVNGVGNQISSVRQQVDGRIASRRSIGRNLNEAASKVREAAKKLKKIHQFVDVSMDLYVKADKKADRFKEPEKKSVWDKMKDIFGTADDVVSGFRKGVAEAVFSSVEGIWNAITHPIETAKGIVYAVSHPVETAKSIWKSISDSWKNDVINGDAKSRSQWFGRAIGEVALAVIGTKGVDKAIKMAKGAKVVEEAGGVRVVRKDTAQAPNIINNKDAGISGISNTVKGKFDFDSTQGLKGFSEKLPSYLEMNGINIERFHDLRLKAVDKLTDSEVNIIKNIRDAVPPVNNKTLLQKTIPVGEIENYLSGKYTEIGGYVAKVEDVSNVRMYDDVIETSRLDYTLNDGTRPYPVNGTSYGMIRFKTTQSDMVEIPYGERFGGNNKDGPPCTQNGFTAARNGMVVPEWTFNGRFKPKPGAELYHVENGQETLIAIFDGKKFVDINQN